MKTTEQKVIKFINRYQLVNPGDKLLIALSGGADSVFGLLFFNKFKKLFNCQIAAYHLNHMLRGDEADSDESFCKLLCAENEITFISERLEVQKYSDENSLSLEEAARILRYSGLEKARLKENCNKIVTAHNMSDNTETVLFNLFKGTGIDGLSGIPVIRDVIIRPFLPLSKEEIRNYLQNMGQEFRIDSSNLKNDFQRNFIRNEIVPRIREKINPRLDEAMFRNSAILRELQTDMDQEISSLYKRYVQVKEDGSTILLTLFSETNDMKSGLVLKLLFENVLKIEYTYEDFEKIKMLAESSPGKTVQLKSGLQAIREREFLKFYLPDTDEEIQEVKLNIGEAVDCGRITVGIEKIESLPESFTSNKDVEYITLDDISGEFILRPWKTGEKFYPIGGKGTKNVSEFLTDEKIDSYQKKRQLVLCNGNEIVWVVGLRLDNNYKITNKTKRIGKLWMK